MRSPLSALVMVLSLAPPTMGQTPASIVSSVDTESISLGGRLTLSLSVEHAPGQTVLWPALPDTIGKFEILAVSPGQPFETEGRSASSVHFLLTAFELGELEIPTIEVAVVDSAGGDPEVLSTEPIAVVVESVGLDESGDIRTVKAPLEIPRNWLLLIPWLLLVAAAVAFTFWAYRRLKNRKRDVNEKAKPAVPARPPHEVAYEALDRLEAKGRIDRGEIKLYFIEVSEIIRTYLEGRYNIDALEMTSYEVLRDLKSVGLEQVVLDSFARFFDRSDLVKFAKLRPSPAASHEMIDIARKLVDDTKVRESGLREERTQDGEDSDASAKNKRHVATVS